jgi:nitroreductase
LEFFETVRNRFSARRFTGQPVREDDLRVILEAATLAPSATNEQPWRFIVVRNRELKDSMRAVVMAVLEASIAGTDDQARRTRLARMRLYSTHFAGAPVAIAVLARPWGAGGYGRHADSTSRDLAAQSVAMAVDHLLLAATALGYGACFASAPAEFAREELEPILGVETPWFLLGVVSLGVPSKLPRERSPRRPLDEVCSFID